MLCDLFTVSMAFVVVIVCSFVCMFCCCCCFHMLQNICAANEKAHKHTMFHWNCVLSSHFIQKHSICTVLRNRSECAKIIVYVLVLNALFISSSSFAWWWLIHTLWLHFVYIHWESWSYRKLSKTQEKKEQPNAWWTLWVNKHRFLYRSSEINVAHQTHNRIKCMELKK